MTRALSIRKASITPDSVVIFQIELKSEEGSNIKLLSRKRAAIFEGCLFLVWLCFVGQHNTEPSGQVGLSHRCRTLREQIKNGWITKEVPSKDKKREEEKMGKMQQELLLVLLETLDFLKIDRKSVV